MAMPVNKKAQNYRQARAAGFKPGTAIRDDSGKVTGGTPLKRKLPPLPSNPVKPAGGSDPNSGVSSPSLGANPVRGIPAPVNPMATERGRGPGGPINDTPSMPPVGRPQGPMPQLPNQVKPIGMTPGMPADLNSMISYSKPPGGSPSGGIYAGGGPGPMGGGMQAGSQGAMDIGRLPPGGIPGQTPGFVPDIPQTAQPMPMQSPPMGGDAQNQQMGQQLAQLRQMQLPKRFGGNAMAALQFLQQNPQSQFAQRMNNPVNMPVSTTNPMLMGL